jgi:hypothetical protein
MKIHLKKNSKSQQSLFSFFKGSLSRNIYVMKRKHEIPKNAKMELENVNPNGDNVVVNNLNNIKFSFWKIVKIEFKHKHHMLFISKEYHDFSKFKIPHVVHLTNQHPINQSFPYRYGSIPQGKSLK